MNKILYIITIALMGFQMTNAQGSGPNGLRVKTSNGELEGLVMGSGIHSFKGVPFAAPPVGALRFREPQPVRNWEGVRKADTFGPRAMQPPIFSDMQFRSNGMSEDCLYLNVWTPAKSARDKLPVLVYFYGGGFVAGDGSEYRYDGESLAKRGIVTVTVNYRLGVFGFLAHPELTKESAHHSSGNYGLMDQHAALVWVQKNIAAFGGDPKRVTIGGESAGSIAVCAQMASPLSKGLFAGAIGESGGLMGSIKPVSLVDAEQNGVAFVSQTGKSLTDLRALPAEELLAMTSKGAHFPTAIDGNFLPNSPSDIFIAGAQMSVPLLAGWNSAEGGYEGILGKDEPTVGNYENAIRRLYGGKADTILKLYSASSPEEVKQAAIDLASDRFIANSTSKWIDLHSKTGGKPVYRYIYNHPRPPMTDGSDAQRYHPMGAGHSWEIEYALGNLPTNKVYSWTADDEKVSQTLEAYFENFIKTGDPNGAGLLSWPVVKPAAPLVMWIDVNSHVAAEQHAARYAFLDTLY
jgi:para-nitrobenzyl esterase